MNATDNLDTKHLPDRWNNVTLSQLAGLMCKSIQTHIAIHMESDSDPTEIPRETLSAVVTDRCTHVPAAVFDWLQLYCQEHNRFFDLSVTKSTIAFRFWEDEPVVKPAKGPKREYTDVL